MTEHQAIQFLSEIRRPLLALHKAILDHERASYEKEFGPVTPAAFLQVLINGSAFPRLPPLPPAPEPATGLFPPEQPNNAFLPRYLPLLQADPAILHHHGQVSQLLRSAE